MLKRTSKVLLRLTFVPSLVLLVGFSAVSALAQTLPSVLAGNEQNVSGEQNANLTSSPSANVTVQSITGGGASYRMTPNAPGMPSFAGGPCIGSGVAASGAVPGVSFGGGVTKEDESCQRRNWVQTLIGASQSMSPEDALFMKRLAFEVMRDDEYLSPGFARLGIEAPTNTVRKNMWGKPKVVSAATATSDLPIGYIDTFDQKPIDMVSQETIEVSRPEAKAVAGCVVVVAESAPEQMKSLLTSKGCEVVVR
jgi:hypothetical protein